MCFAFTFFCSQTGKGFSSILPTKIELEGINYVSINMEL